MPVLPQNVQSEHGALQGSWPGVSRCREDGGEVGGVSGRAKGGGGPGGGAAGAGPLGRALLVPRVPVAPRGASAHAVALRTAQP